jgi:hypothetical protein
MDSSALVKVDASYASKLLVTQSFRIGRWGELVAAADVDSISMSPPEEALPLYVLCTHLCEWILSGNWTVLQFDNSTFPSADEVAVFERLLLRGERWNPLEERSFVLKGGDAEDPSRKTTLVLLIYASLMFCWHVHVVSERSALGKRLALMDGVVHFFGDRNALQEAQQLLHAVASQPLAMPRNAAKP